MLSEFRGRPRLGREARLDVKLGGAKGVRRSSVLLYREGRATAIEGKQIFCSAAEGGRSWSFAAAVTVAVAVFVPMDMPLLC